MTPIKQVLKHRDPATANSTPEPWSRSRKERFGGYGSQYVKDTTGTPGTSPRRAPQKRSSTTATTPAKTERYATPAERMIPSEVKLDPVFSSATDRFNLPTSVYAKSTETPGVGAYVLSDEALAARVRGAVKLQAAVRRRQSRGIFASERFTGHGTIHESSTHRRGSAVPGVGEYSPTEPRERQKGGGAVSAFKGGHEDRFARYDSIYVTSASEDHCLQPPPTHQPSWATAAARTPTLPKRDEPSAAFASAANGGHVDRFNTPGSIYHASQIAATPGVGAYDITGERMKDNGAKEVLHLDKKLASSAMASSTDRFGTLLPGSVYYSAHTDAPGVNTYDVPDSGMAARVRGVVRLQAAIRRRQSLGVAKQQKQQKQQKEPKQSKHEQATCPDVAVPMPTPDTSPTPCAICSDVHAGVLRQVLETMPTIEEAPTTVITQDEEAYVPFAPAETVAQSSSLVHGKSIPRLSHVVSLDAMLGDLDGDDDVSSDPEAAESLALKAEEEAQEAVAAEEARTAAVALALEAEAEDEAEEEDAADGEWLFSQLQRISPEVVDRADYYSESGGWDLMGLRSDLAIYMELDIA